MIDSGRWKLWERGILQGAVANNLFLISGRRNTFLFPVLEDFPFQVRSDEKPCDCGYPREDGVYKPVIPWTTAQHTGPHSMSQQLRRDKITSLFQPSHRSSRNFILVLRWIIFFENFSDGVLGEFFVGVAGRGDGSGTNAVDGNIRGGTIDWIFSSGAIVEVHF